MTPEPRSVATIEQPGAQPRRPRPLRLHPRNFLSLPRALLFVVLLLFTGFALGTSTLLGPVHWLTDFGLRAGWAPPIERILIWTLMGALTLSSTAIALWLGALALRRSRAVIRLAAVVLPIFLGAAAGWLWFHPRLVQGDSIVESAEPAGRSPVSQFVFGPYPTSERLVELREQGFRGVITLLHPAVVPFEPQLIAQERRDAAAAGIELIHLPLLPWIGRNAESLRTLEEIALSGEGPYYVHCYLGRDRIRLAQRVVGAVSGWGPPEGHEPSQWSSMQGPDGQTLPFERGNVEVLGDRGYLVPFPTEDEFLRFMAGGEMRRFVSLLDPAVSQKSIDKVRDWCETYRVPFSLLSISLQKYDPWQVLEAARAVKAMDPPVMVSSFWAADSGRSVASETFLDAFRTDLPPLSVSRLEGTAFRRLAPHVVTTSAEPDEVEWATLAELGVRAAVYVGAAASGELERAAEQYGIELRAIAADSIEPTALSAGPYLVFGPGLDEVGESSIRTSFERPAAGEPEATPDSAPTTPVTLADNLEAVLPGSSPPFEHLLRNLLPTYRQMVVWSPLMLLLVAGSGSFAGWLRTSRGVRAPYTRKVFHFLIFSLAALVQLTGGLTAVLWFGGLTALAVLWAVFLGSDSSLYEAMARPTDEPHPKLLVLVPLCSTALGGLAANLLFPGFAPVGYFVAGWGDALGEPVGTAIGRHRYRVPSLGGVRCWRSLEGSGAVLVGGSLAALVALLLAGFDPSAAARVALASGFVGAIVEAISTHGTDNLTTQLAGAGVAYWLLG